MAAMVELRTVVKEYPLGKLTVRALESVDLTIEKGEFTVIAGPSGSGKTTLLNMVGCVDVPTSGTVLIDGQSTSALNDRQRTNLRLNKLGFIFQTFNLIPVLTAAQNVEFPPAAAGAALDQGALSAGGGDGGAGGAHPPAPAAPQRALRRAAPAGGHRPGADLAAEHRAGR